MYSASSSFLGKVGASTSPVCRNNLLCSLYELSNSLRWQSISCHLNKPFGMWRYVSPWTGHCERTHKEAQRNAVLWCVVCSSRFYADLRCWAIEPGNTILWRRFDMDMQTTGRCTCFSLQRVVLMVVPPVRCRHYTVLLPTLPSAGTSA